MTRTNTHRLLNISVTYSYLCCFTPLLSLPKPAVGDKNREPVLSVCFRSYKLFLYALITFETHMKADLADSFLVYLMPMTRSQLCCYSVQQHSLSWYIALIKSYQFPSNLPSLGRLQSQSPGQNCYESLSSVLIIIKLASVSLGCCIWSWSSCAYWEAAEPSSVAH